MTRAEIADLNRRALDHLQEIVDELWSANYQPGPLALQLDPSGERAMGSFRIDDYGSWIDIGHEGRAREFVQSHGRGLTSLVEYCGRCDEVEAAVALRDFVARLPEPARPIMRPVVGGPEGARAPEHVKPIRDPRSLRRVS
jgi:hypothetical protein